MMLRSIALAGVAVSLISGPTLAHHSFAMFDSEITLEVQATVMELQWTNPHSWLELTVMNEQGQESPLALEMSSPTSMARSGWNPRTVVPGDQITISYHPMKDGTPQGQFISLTKADGTELSD
jgi:hypothetical protein